MGTQSADQLAEALTLLEHRRSPKRRAGAKRLRKMREASAGPTLLKALQKELRDPRTWETQYQMIMALGESNYRHALPYLRSLIHQPFTATMLYTALGDAIVRLGRQHSNDPAPVLELMGMGNDELTDGAFRAVAIMQLELDARATKKIIKYVSGRSQDDPLRFWVVAAAPGWSGKHVEQFVDSCAQSSRDDIRQAALAAQQRRYLKWKPL